jgi:hypothetical protein
VVADGPRFGTQHVTQWRGRRNDLIQQPGQRVRSGAVTPQQRLHHEPWRQACDASQPRCCRCIRSLHPRTCQWRLGEQRSIKGLAHARADEGDQCSFSRRGLSVAEGLGHTLTQQIKNGIAALGGAAWVQQQRQLRAAQAGCVTSHRQDMGTRSQRLNLHVAGRLFQRPQDPFAIVRTWQDPQPPWRVGCKR